MPVQWLDQHRDLALSEASRLARRLARRLGLAVDHQEDIRQELLLDLLERHARFDPCRSPFSAFLRMIMRNRLSVLQARYLRELTRPVVPLDDAAGGHSSEGFEVDDSRKRTSFARVEARADLDRILEHLPGSLRAIVVGLEERDLAEAVAELGASRATIYRRLADLRLVLLTWGLQPAA